MKSTVRSIYSLLMQVNRQRKCALMESQFCITEVADLLRNVRPLLAHTVCSAFYSALFQVLFFVIFQRNIEKLVPFGFVADTATKKNIFIVSQRKSYVYFCAIRSLYNPALGYKILHCQNGKGYSL